MNRIADSGSRPYASELRREQASRTRERIVEATVRTLGRGVSELSVPAVAREAGVSVPTIYRHFGTKSGLIAALFPHFSARSGLDRMPPIRSFADVAEAIRTVYRQLALLEPEIRAATLGEIGRESRRTSIPQRLAVFRGAINELAPDATPEDREHIAGLVLLLTSSAVFRAYGEYLGLDPAAAAEHAIHILRDAFEAARIPTEGGSVK